MVKNIKILKKETVNYLLLLFLTIFIPVLLFGIRQGFYWDDWSQLLLHEKYGDNVFPEYFSYDRPFSWWTHVIAFRLCNNSPVLWHIYFGIIHFLSVYVTYLVFKDLFPQHKTVCKVSCVLLTICPVFTQYSISIAYSQHFTDYLLFILSFYVLFQASENKNEKKKYLLYFVSFILTAAHLSITEYFAFLDLTKIFIIYHKEQEHKKIFDEVIILSGTIMIFIGFVLVRQSISSWDQNFNANTTKILDTLNEDFFEAISDTAKNILYDITWLTGRFPSDLFFVDFDTLLTKTNLFILIVSAFLSILPAKYFLNHNFYERNSRCTKMVVFSVIWIFLGIAPFWMMNENCFSSIDPYHADRCFLAAQPGICLFISYIIYRLFTDNKRFVIVSAAIICLFSLTYLKNEQNAIFEKEKQNKFYQQIIERIPAFKQETAIFSEAPIFPEQGNFATASALNIIYSEKRNNEQTNLPLWVFGSPQQQNSENKWFSVSKRNYNFASDKGIFVIPDNKHGNCAWFMTKEDAEAPHLTDQERKLTLLSDIDMIDTSSAIKNINKNMFGNKKENWCLYYQKASLLRQQKDWNGISNLYDEVREKGYTPFDNRSNAPFEWVPFIVGLNNSGRDGDAIEVMDKCISIDYAYKDWLKQFISKNQN